MSAVDSLLVMMAVGEMPEDRKDVTDIPETIEIMPGKSDNETDEYMPCSKNETVVVERGDEVFVVREDSVDEPDEINNTTQVDIQVTQVQLKKPSIPTSLQLKTESVPEIIIHEESKPKEVRKKSPPMKSPIDSSEILDGLGCMITKLASIPTSVGVSPEDVRLFTDAIRSGQMDNGSDPQMLRENDSQASTDKTGTSQVNANETTKEIREGCIGESTVDEESVTSIEPSKESEEDDLNEPDIEALLAEGVDMEEIERMMEEYEKEKKKRKKREKEEKES